jgi:hypothetical protein
MLPNKNVIYMTNFLRLSSTAPTIRLQSLPSESCLLCYWERREINQEKTDQSINTNTYTVDHMLCLQPASCWFATGITLQFWRWRCSFETSADSPDYTGYIAEDRTLHTYIGTSLNHSLNIHLRYSFLIYWNLWIYYVKRPQARTYSHT